MYDRYKKIIRETYVALAVLCAVVLFLYFNFFMQEVKYFFQSHKGSSSSVTTQPIGQPNFLQIDSLKIAAPIIYVDQKSEKVFQEALANGVVHYPGTASPGEMGNAYIFGHSSDFAWSKGNYKTVFGLLPKIQLGDKIQISDQSGREFVYTVTKTFVTSPDDLSVLDQFNNSKKILTLQTSYPVGTVLKRFIVQSELAQ